MSENTLLCDPVRLTTTLRRLKSAGACPYRYGHFLDFLGRATYDHDKPINLLTVLDSNGIDDAIWALCATAENCSIVSRVMAADFAELVLPLYESKYSDDHSPRLAIQAARDFAIGRIGASSMAVACADAWDAALNDRWADAMLAARAASMAASWCDSYIAALAALSDAARAASIADILDPVMAEARLIVRRYLLTDDTEA